jgi:FkbM family methyltransferase
MSLPRSSKFASEVFITHCNVDWGSEALFASHLDPAGVALDVGANIGYYSLYVLPLVSEVHAFEPDPTACAILKKNLAGNSSRAFVYQTAVGNRHGKAKFVVENDPEISHLVELVCDSDTTVQDVNVTTIDRFVAVHKLTVTGIKIDVEGADFQVLEGSLDTLKLQCPLVLVETSAEDRLFQLLTPLGYMVFAFTKVPDCRCFQFQGIIAETNLRTKMLFLVPERLHDTFLALARSDVTQ